MQCAVDQMVLWRCARNKIDFGSVFLHENFQWVSPFFIYIQRDCLGCRDQEVEDVGGSWADY
jgi:hypothetical protein